MPKESPKESPKDPQALLRKMLAKDRRYPRDAYQFVFEALDYTIKQLGERRHVTAAELLDGVRALALKEFGLLARMVLVAWGIRRTDDVGEIVYNLVEAGLMRINEGDRKEDFAGVFDLDEALWDQPRARFLSGDSET